jgi:hypothetical protein
MTNVFTPLQLAAVSRIQCLLVCCALTIQSTSAWTYFDQDEDIWFVSLLALGILVVIFIVIYCTKEVDPYLSPVHPYIPRDGLYVAEYREPDGLGKRNVYLTFGGDEEKGWKILSQTKGVKINELRSLCVTGGYVDPSGKMWWREEGPGTEVESYGRYDLSKGTFTGTWLATHKPRDQKVSDNSEHEHPKESIIASSSKGANVRRVKYTSFYHSQSYPATVPKPSSRYGKSKDISKIANDYTAMENDYVNVGKNPDGDDYDIDAVLVARHGMNERNPSHPSRPNKYSSSRGGTSSHDPPAYRNRAGQVAARIFSHFDKTTNNKHNNNERAVSPDPDYVKIEQTTSIAPVGNDDATMNSEFAPNLRHDNTFQTNDSFA